MLTFRILKWQRCYFNVFWVPKNIQEVQITCDIGGEGEGEKSGKGMSRLALLVELVEDRGEQWRDDLEGVERTAPRAGRGDDECARGIARGHADDLSGQARQGSVR